MQSVRHDRFEVFIYESLLDTRCSLLKELYCESHRQEPWAVWGRQAPYGALRFPNVLYVDAAERQRLREAITGQLLEGPGYPFEVERRFRAAGRELLRGLQRLKRARGSPRQVFEAAARVLSSGVFKENLEPPQLTAFLAQLMPVAQLSPRLSQLYQPRCLPHPLKQRAQLLFAASRLQGRARPRSAQVRAAAARSGYLSDFLMEDGPLDAPEPMARELERLRDEVGGSARRLLEARRALLERHQRAVGAAQELEREVLSTAAATGASTLRTRRVVLDVLRLVAWLSTAEELKHILSLQAARALRRCVEEKGLSLEHTSLERLAKSWQRLRRRR
ncbi:MAG: hypothetical protein IPJ65_03930 [Archangiaceae bacterium]|nr:hypothetical protein [Archangiaceae bacterium]